MAFKTSLFFLFQNLLFLFLNSFQYSNRSNCLIFFSSQDTPISSKMFEKQINVDLIIIGAGCVGIAAAYYALKSNKTVCVIEKSQIKSNDRYWSSSFSARQNRIQYNEEYLTKFVIQSNQEWKRLEKNPDNDFGGNHKFMYEQGSVWFGDRKVQLSEGNIKLSADVLQQINNQNKKSNKYEKKIQWNTLTKISPGTPQYLKAFKIKNNNVWEWDSWEALYQKNGGSIDMKQSYSAFYYYIQQKIKEKKAYIVDHATIKSLKNDDKKQVIVDVGTSNVCIHSQKIFVATGVYTPYFLKDHFGVDFFVNGNDDLQQFEIQQYVASYFAIQEGYQSLYEQIPTFINFFEDPQSNSSSSSGYGFPFHQWDNLETPTKKKFVKLGTTNYNVIKTQDQLESLSKRKGPITDQQDHRIKTAKDYAGNRMVGLNVNDPDNKHFPCPIIFYTGRQTILDYLNRRDQSVVVQSGGWIAKYYPLLAQVAIRMLFKPNEIYEERRNQTVIGTFLNRTRFPVKSYLKDQMKLEKNPYPKNGTFETVVIGGGSSGLYTAYRLNNSGHKGIGLFEMTPRISGRLKSFYFKNTNTPMQLGGMRYIPLNHHLVNKVIQIQQIPATDFDMKGNPIQQIALKAYLRATHHSMTDWQSSQTADVNMITNYKLSNEVVGMDSTQIISYSFFLILTDPANVDLIQKVFAERDQNDILEEKQKLRKQGEHVNNEEYYYHDYRNYIYQDPNNKYNYYINISLRIWNIIKPVLLFPYPYRSRNNLSQDYFPLYQFGFQNVLISQFGNEAYQFVADHNGYYSNTSNASYLDQVMAYLLDFGDVKYNTLIGGFDSINYGMAGSLLDQKSGIRKKNGGVYLNHKLVNIEKIQKQSKYLDCGDSKYVLTFHIPKEVVVPQEEQKEAEKRKKRKAEKKKSLIEFCKKKIKSFAQNSHSNFKRYGELIRLDNNSDVYELKVKCKSIVLGMPKKSIIDLTEEIPLFKNEQISDSYEQYFKEDQKYYNNFIKGQKYYKKQFNDLKSNTVKGGKGVGNYNYNSQFINEDGGRQKIEKFKKNPPKKPKLLFDLTQSTQTMPAIKICMNFDRNWWDPVLILNEKQKQNSNNQNDIFIDDSEQMRGASITDLPIRKTFYFSSGSDNLLLSSYNDMQSAEFWTQIQNNIKEEWVNPDKRKCRIEKMKIKYDRNENITPGSAALVTEVLNQLSLIHKIKVNESWLLQCVYQYWGNDPYGAGYHNFYSGYYIPTIMKTLRRPWKQESIHFVGEAYSNVTGWVEGAFQTAEHVLRDFYGVPPLKIDQKDYDGYYIGY